MLLPYIGKRDSLADLGCGVGLIDFPLSRHISNITCVDVNPDALAHLSRFAADRNILNIQTHCADAYECAGQWDTVLAVFFGSIDEAIHHFLRLCRESVIAVVHADAQGKLGPSAYHPPKCNTVTRTKQALDALGIDYTCLESALEYGQPFSSLEEARAFVKAYSKTPPGCVIDDYLRDTLTETDDRQFPYYLPNLKSFGIFHIRRDPYADI